MAGEKDVWLCKKLETVFLVKSGTSNCNLSHSFGSMLFVLFMRIADTFSES